MAKTHLLTSSSVNFDTSSDHADRYMVAYLRRLALPVDEASTAHKAALDRAHELRKFEIENYWKRSAYFWGFQLVAFGALALTAKEGRFYPPVVLIVSVMGALAALTGLLSAKGSKFWQQNWEAHVDYLEVAVEGKLHTTALVEHKLSFSVSRVNERFLLVLMLGWLSAFLIAVAVIRQPDLMTLPQQRAGFLQITGAASALAVGVVVIGFGQKSRLRGRAFYRQGMAPLATPRHNRLVRALQSLRRVSRRAT